MRNSFKDLTFEELLAKREEMIAKYRDLRFQRVVGHVDNPVQKRVMRRQIARLNTLIYNHEEVVQESGASGNEG
ncbi:50S ribosomal protein L29 [Spirochaeta africana]|uniref:Large ribosomal subunit protein uL29 n=1 Tax=Spirochaeta africana (strain ATCC 700263 / DSM 8902 / Z-7692) TaxID=889378 RepID=H9UGM0_SPIAZ|nr:50S ribosomal protein L29 [Spirochaeta africana]AFG36663.1 ribosomal protein L29 [Spirochaeta africana DSM 8902]